MSIATEITRLQNAKSAIKTAIEAKGMDVGSAKLDAYASKIDAIQQIGVVGTGTFLVRFFDFDGTILRQERVNAGGNATAPTTPTHQYLTFNSWNNAFTNVQNDIDTGAIYDTTDGKSYLFITLTTVTGLSPTLYLNKSTTSLMTINWGDGTTSTSTTSGNFNINHTYSSAGDYIITIDNSLGGVYGFGNGSTTTSILGNTNYSYILKKCYIGNNVNQLIDYCFKACYSLLLISIPYSIANIQTWVFNLSYSLFHVNIPAGCNINSQVFNNCITINNIIFPTASDNVSNQLFEACYSLKKIIIHTTATEIPRLTYACFSITKLNFPSSITIIDAAAFANSFNIIEYVFLSITPPTLANTNAFSGINPICKIYVPDASVEDYKAATNWNTYANYIYPLSSRP
jgi:hypothetical protein